MMRPLPASLIVIFCALSFAPGCGDDEPENTAPKECSPVAQTGCAANLVCEEVEGGKPACFAPVSVQGKVFDALKTTAIGGARVVARDANDAAVSTVAVTAADGTYSLRVPARRAADGKIISIKYTLRADAAAYDVFPRAPRVAIPIDVIDAAGEPPVVKSAATDIALIPLPNASTFGSIAGKVVAEAPGGTLVVAGGATGVADSAGNYVVFNVPAGTADVRGYAAGLNFDAKSAMVTAGKQTTGVDLTANGKPTAKVSGKIEIVNGGGAGSTSVVLAVKETFSMDAARGEVPRGLRVGNVSGDFVIEDVPDGEYVILAAFENDGLVRDPDTSIGGTGLVTITVAGMDLPIAKSFKVTGALEVLKPGAQDIETISGTPTFEWVDDSSEDLYKLKVFDALGTMVWETEGNFDPGGSAPVSVQYAGPALMPGMIYQFRATSIKGGVPISQTEDLKGVFLYK